MSLERNLLPWCQWVLGVSKISTTVYLRLSSLLPSSWNPKGSTCECQELWVSGKDLRWWYSWEGEKQEGSQTQMLVAPPRDLALTTLTTCDGSNLLFLCRASERGWWP